MPTLHIEHAITDVGTWKQAFDRFEEARRAAGVLAHRVHRPIDDPHFVVIDLDFTSVSQARAFLEFLTTEVWAHPERAPALAGTPRTRIIEPVG